MFVRKDKNGNLVAAGSINHARLAQLQADAKKPKKAASKAAPKAEAPKAEAPKVEAPKVEPEPKPKPEEPVFKSALDKEA